MPISGRGVIVFTRVRDEYLLPLLEHTYKMTGGHFGDCVPIHGMKTVYAGSILRPTLRIRD